MTLFKKLSTKIFKKKFFIFDFDGTICNNDSIHEAAFSSVLNGFNIQFSYSEIKGMKTIDAFQILFKKHRISLNDKLLSGLVFEKQKLASEMLKKDPKLVDGFLEFHKLTPSRRKCIVSSGSERNIRSTLKHFNIENDFNLIVHSGSVSNSKPHPEGFNLAIEFFKCDKNDALVFEDSKAGFIAAECANIDCVDINQFHWKMLTESFNNEESY